MSANLQPITSDGGFITGGNIAVSGFPVASPAPYINGFSSVEALDQLKIGDARFYSNGTITNSTLSVDANTSARLSVIDPNTVFNTYFQAVENYANIYVANGSGDATWRFTSDGNLTLPGNTFSVNYANGTQVSLGGSYSNADVANYLPTFTGGNIGSPTGGQGVTNLNLSGNIVATPQLMSINWGTYHMDFSQYGRVEINSDLFANANTIGAQYLKGDGSNISNIAGANVSGLGNITTVNLTGSNTNVLYGNGTFAAPVAEASFSIQTANFNANAGSRYGVNTSGGAVTATLPASPATGEAIFFADAGGAYASNNLTIARNGQTIMGAASDLTVGTNNQSVGLFYNGTTWRTYNAG